jgi:hypothetical protein
MKSALFVDFDNVFSQLRQLQPDAAERFARHPSDWISWLTNSLALPEPKAEGERRRLLVRRCYLNPNWYQTYRHAFLRAGFEIVDCPPVTSQGKTSTDIHMVLDSSICCSTRRAVTSSSSSRPMLTSRRSCANFGDTTGGQRSWPLVFPLPRIRRRQTC